MISYRVLLGSVAMLALAACGGGGAGVAGGPIVVAPVIAAPESNQGGVQVIPAGGSHTMAAGEKVLVPAGTTVISNGSSVILNGSNNTVNVAPGAVVRVPSSATGKADNTVVASAAAPGLAVNAQAIAGPSAMGAYDPVDGTGDQARFGRIGQLALDGAGNLLASDRGRVRRITPDGVVSTLAASVVLTFDGVAADGQGNIYGSDSVSNVLYRRSPDGTVKPWGPDWSRQAVSMGGRLAMDGAGTVYRADFENRRILKITAAGVLSVLAGGGSGDGNDGVGVNAAFHGPCALVLDASGALLVNDSDAIRKILPDGTVTTLARIPKRVIPVDGSIAVDHGYIYVATDSAIVRVAPDHSSTTMHFANGSVPYILSLVADGHGTLYAGTGWSSPAQVWKIAL
jgi:sugar lactone lactonase YvrE